MVMVQGPFILRRFLTVGPLRRLWSDDMFKTFTIILSIFAVVFAAVMGTVTVNGNSNCHTHYGGKYSYDMDSHLGKCLNKQTGDRKPIVVQK